MPAPSVPLLQQLREAPVLGVTSDAAGLSLTLGATGLSATLGGATRLTFVWPAAGPPRLQPWIGAETMDLADAVRRFRLTVLGCMDEAGGSAKLLLAARRVAGEASALNGGFAVLPGALPAIAMQSGQAVSPHDLLSAASARAASHLLGSGPVELRRRLAAILDGSVYPLLRSAGFHVTAALSYRLGLPMVHFVEPTRSRWTTAIAAEFGFELGVAIGPIETRRMTKQVLITQGMPALVRPAGSLWGWPTFPYAIRPDTDPEELSGRLLHDFGSQVLPWFARLDSPDALIAFLADEDRERGDHMNAHFIGMLLGRLQRRSEARRYFEQVTGPRPAVARVAAMYGIVLDG